LLPGGSLRPYSGGGGGGGGGASAFAAPPAAAAASAAASSLSAAFPPPPPPPLSAAAAADDAAYGSGGGGGGSAAADAPALSRRERYLAMDARERGAAAMLAEMAPADVDGALGSLADFLPPSEAEVTGLLHGLSAHLRRALLAQADLRAAWAASRRAAFAVPASVGVEARLRVAAQAAGALPGGEPARWLAGGAAAGGGGGGDDDDDDAAAGGGVVVTLGEGRLALELHVKVAQQAAEIGRLRAQLAAQQQMLGT
jgi:hypothetical protein